MTSPGRDAQTSIYINGLAGRHPAVPVAADALEAAAERAMSREAWAYVAGGAGSGSTMRANRDALDACRIVPRMLRDAGTRDLSTTLLGHTLPAPLLLAPIGVLEMAHQDSDLAVARAARALGVPMILSNQASVPMERVATELGPTPRFFQLYWSTSNELVRSFVWRAEQSGCSAIVLTLDTTLLGWRTRDLDLAWLPFMRGMGIAQYTSDPVFREQIKQPLDGPPAPRPPITIEAILALLGVRSAAARASLTTEQMRAAIQRFTATYSRPSLNWDDLPFLRSLTKLPIILKGIQHPDDARRAIDAGMNGIVVSNHGGRQVDGAVGSLRALPGIARAVKGEVPILFDSGIRTGSDVFKAVALGATAVLLGRPYVYGLAIAGETGVREVIRNVIAELDLTLGLSGHRAVRDLSPDALEV